MVTRVRNSSLLRGDIKKSSHDKGWCGPSWVRSPSDFDNIDAFGLRFLSHGLVPQVTDMLANKKKTFHWEVACLEGGKGNRVRLEEDLD
jgi:hypothetical protein